MSTIVINRRRIPELVSVGRRLGRHVNHDSRSKLYRVERSATQVTKIWKRETAILDQGDLGSCTGNASTGILGTDPHYQALSSLLSGGLKLDEPEAIKIYSLATSLDSYAGTYPPTDTGSDGLSAAKACQQLGLISGYTHALSVDDVINGLQNGPMITGTNWYTSMDSPDGSGLVTVSGKVRGGHEYATVGVDMEKEVFHFDNSWGTTFGLSGTFMYSFVSMERLLKEEGDSTYFVPISQTPPQPQPQPGDGNTKTFTDADFASLEKWAQSPHIFHNATMAAKAWKAGK